MLNILVMGAGAIGCFVGGTLAANGHNVTLVGRPALMDHIAGHGLSILWPGKAPQQTFLQTATAVPLAGSPYDFILLTVKSPATAAAAQELSALRLDGTSIVSLQNGIGNEELLADKFVPERIVAGTITIPIEVPDVGTIRVSKAKGGLGLASLRAGRPEELLATALNASGLTTLTYPDYRAMKWSKLLLNIVNNASSAILNQRPTEIISQPELFNLEIAALREGVAVMQALGINAVKLPGYPVQWLARLVSARWLPLPAQRAILRPFMRSGRGSKMPSLHIDLASGRSSSEIEALNGAIVAAGRQVGVPTPVNRALTQIMSGLIAGQLDWADYQHHPERLLQAAAGR